MYINVNDLSLINLSEMCWYFYHMALWQSLLLGHVVTKPLHVQLLFCWIWPFELVSETELNFCLLIFIKEIYPPHGNSGDHISVICRYKAAFSVRYLIGFPAVLWPADIPTYCRLFFMKSSVWRSDVWLTVATGLCVKTTQ